ncbi:uncharacterized protein BYT42DRAFT_616194 [Radiomyces spectabilis]|uniref:uncharacterized protein n=1 Tax=Radiomyces spectabilis TaxID=64574 RepID=UPI002220BBB1|nr:uncharacterized protein BYT42DRAFT_616194 [Radiomyces spectabilis]KAI8373005.1 hypothetical protein BYT42DRAFT_616194 [Radiomyces spectabilis]
MSSKAQLSRLDHLAKASHALTLSCPSLSRFYMNQLQQNVRDFDIEPGKAFRRLACVKCGQLILPGKYTSVTLKKKGSKEKGTKRKNQLVYRCNACCYSYALKGSHRNLIPISATRGTQPLTTMPPTVTASQSIQSSPLSTFSSSSSSSTASSRPHTAPLQTSPSPLQAKKKNKKKKNNLQALLASRKEKEQQQQQNSFGLNDFLSSL